MDAHQAIETKDIEQKTTEANLYHSMGLCQEALDIFERLISDQGDQLGAEQRKQIEDKIAVLKKDISDSENEPEVDYSQIPKEHISIIKDTFSASKEAKPLLESASAFKELGLYDESIREYEKLLKLKHPVEEIIPGLIECYFQTHSPEEALRNMEKTFVNYTKGDQEKANIKFLLGKETEKMGQRKIALSLFKDAENLGLESKELKDRIQALKAGLSFGSKYNYLLNEGLVSIDQLQKALKLSKKAKKSIEFILIEQFKVKKEDLGKSLSNFYGYPFRTFDPAIPIPIDIISKLKRSFLLYDLWVPIRWRKDGLEILIEDPLDLNRVDHINSLIRNKKISLSVGIREDIEEFIRHFFEEKKPDPTLNLEDADMDIVPEITLEAQEEEEDYQEEEFNESSSQVVRIVDQIVLNAYQRGISDIHIEPSQITKLTDIRFRQDGVCNEFMQVPNTMARAVLSRLKIMAGLDIAERRLPQDGKIKFKRKGFPSFELRLATLPTSGGFEDAVLRILAKGGAMNLDEMGLSKFNLENLKEIMSRAYGLVLVVGPTGSGKTTTLHSALSYINKPGIKIWTAEDPVEITQYGLRQVEAKPGIGLNFARIMRAFLRADPDVIMIGEMRDHETASIGIEASLTGHLVLSTLHTNSAPETLTRLLDMRLNPLNFSDAFLGVLAQRLVRSLCAECKEEYHPSREEFDEIVNDYGEEYFQATGIKYKPDLTLFRRKGCPECAHTGYKGRLGIHELLKGSAEIKKMIKKQSPTEELFTQGFREGMTTLKQDGILKVFQGLTDISEVRRVCNA